MRLGELAGNHGIRFRRDEKAGPLQQESKSPGARGRSGRCRRLALECRGFGGLHCTRTEGKRAPHNRAGLLKKVSTRR